MKSDSLTKMIKSSELMDLQSMPTMDLGSIPSKNCFDELPAYRHVEGMDVGADMDGTVAAPLTRTGTPFTQPLQETTKRIYLLKHIAAKGWSLQAN